MKTDKTRAATDRLPGRLLPAFFCLAVAAAGAAEPSADPPATTVSPPAVLLPSGDRPASGPERQALLARLDQVQRQIDAARKRIGDSKASPESLVQLDAAQQLVDLTRGWLLRGGGADFDENARQRLAEILQRSQASLDRTRVQLEGAPGASGTLARLAEAQRRLDEANAQVDPTPGQAPAAMAPQPPSRAQLQAMYDNARSRLDAARASLLAAPEPHPELLQKLEDAERRLEESRRDLVARGLL